MKETHILRFQGLGFFFFLAGFLHLELCEDINIVLTGYIKGGRLNSWYSVGIARKSMQEEKNRNGGRNRGFRHALNSSEANSNDPCPLVIQLPKSPLSCELTLWVSPPFMIQSHLNGVTSWESSLQLM